MSRIISTFSNTSGDLENLKQEFSSLFRFFNKAENKVKLDFEPYLNEPITEITSRILASQKELGLFHFSGHSGGSGLDFPDDEFSQQHLVDFFNTVNSDKSKLDCIFLNGCENSEIVNKLLNVPVVIGTRTKIQDSVAEKFTQDFFNSLIGAESTYKKAFQDAVAAQSGLKTAIIDRTRSEGADIDLVQENSLNEYFIVINDEKVANSKFPFKKKKTNWTKVIAFFLLAVVLALGFMFRDNILKMFRGYYCPSWMYKDKCHILIADFNYPNTMRNVNEVIAEDIEHSSLSEYMEPLYANAFTKFIREDKIKGNELHSVCGYNFSLTGDVEQIQGKYRMGFRIYSDHEDFQNTNKEFIEIGNLDSLIIKTQSVGLHNGDDFIINRLCLACADQNSELIPIVEKKLKSYASNMESPESYQNMNAHLFELQEKRKDADGMIRALDNISSVGNNDYVLGALEQKSVVLLAEDRIEETYQTQTDYIQEVQARFEAPTSYDMKNSEASYFENKNEMIAKRGDLVLKNHRVLRPQLEQTLNDFEYLQEIGYGGKDYSSQIELVKKLMNESNDDKTYPVSGKIINIDERPIGDVNIQLGFREVMTDENGVFEMGEILEERLFGQKITLTKDGYQTTEISINEPADLERLESIMLEKDANNMSYVLEGEVLDCNHNNANPSTILKEIFIDGTRVPINGIAYSHSLFSKPGEKVVIKPPSGYRFREGRSKEITLGDNSRIENTLHVFSRPEALRVVGRVMNNNEPLIGSNVMLKGTNSGATTDMNGRFSFMGEVDLCSEIVYSFSGLQGKSQLLKNAERRGNTIDVGDIQLIGTIISDDPVRYVLEGRIKMACDHNNTIIDEIFIDNKSIPVNGSSYVYEIFSIPGEQVIIQPPPGYLFREGDGILVTLGETTNIKNSFLVSADPKRVIVRGRVVVQDDPIGGANIKVIGTQDGTITGPEGNFEIWVKMGLCSAIECSASGYQSKKVALDYKSVDGNVLNIGDINLTHEGSGTTETNDLYEVILQCYQASSLQFNRFLGSLKELGYSVSNQSQNFNANNKPANFASRPTIFYYSDDSQTRRKVKLLSTVMEEMTGDDFNIEKISTNNEFITTHIPNDNSKKIIVQWFRGID